MLLNLCSHVLTLIAHFPLQNNRCSPNAEEEDRQLMWAQEKWMQSELHRNRK